MVHCVGHYKKIYKLSMSQKIKTTVFAELSDTLRGIPPKTEKMHKLFIPNFHSL